MTKTTGSTMDGVERMTTKTPLILAEAYLVDLGCPWDIAEEAVGEAAYKLMHEDDPARMIMALTNAWYYYCASPLGETIRSPGFFIASRVQELRTPPLPAGVHLHLNPAQEVGVRLTCLVLERLGVLEQASHPAPPHPEPRPAVVVVRPPR